MYECESCGAVFSTPDTVNLPFDDGVGWRDEYWSVCPVCYDVNFCEIDDDED